MPERFGSNESTFDALRGQTLNLPVNGSAAGAGAADSTYLRLDATNDPVTGALDVKVDSADALRVLTSGSAEVFVADTLANLIMGRLNEVWVQETNYLVVDAGGLGDYTTIQAALDYIMALAGSQTYTILLRDGTYAEILTLTGGVGSQKTVTIVGLDKEVTIAPALAAAQNVINANTYTAFNFINVKIIPGGTSSGAIASMGSGVVVNFERCLIEPLSGMLMAKGGSSTANCYRCTIGKSGTGWLMATTGVGSNLFAYYCHILGSALSSNGLISCSNSVVEKYYYCIITNGNQATGYDLFNTGSGSLSVSRCTYNRTKTSGTITVLDGDIPALQGNDIAAALIVVVTFEGESIVNNGDLVWSY